MHASGMVADSRRLLPEEFEVVDDVMARVYATMSGAERLAIAARMFCSARDMLISHLRTEHPEWNEERVLQEVARRLSHGAV